VRNLTFETVIGKHLTYETQNLPREAWQDVLVAVDKTYAELVDYQERLETQNNELNALRRFLSSVLSSISDYLIVIDRSGKVIEAGEAVCAAVNAPLALIKTWTAKDVFRATDSSELGTHLSYVISSRNTVTLDAEIIGPQGAEPVELRISPQMDRRRKVIGAVLTARPLGELRRAFADLESSHEELKMAQVQLVRNEKLASLGRLLAGVAHELNNPISFVYANSHAMEKYIEAFERYFESVARGASREELIVLRAELKLDRQITNLRTALDGSREGAKRVRDLVDDLRRLSADGSGEFERFDIVDLTKNALVWIERGNKQSFVVQYHGADEAFAMGRVGHIRQVLLNLMQNAADAVETIENPEIHVVFEVRPNDIVLRISDNGLGIEADKVEKIFDPFFTTKEVGRGTGLGLSISYKIVEEHGGSLRYLPSKKGGACFELVLPARFGA
jgi:two-component system sensor histidine kinase HupT/HoxJ